MNCATLARTTARLAIAAIGIYAVAGCSTSLPEDLPCPVASAMTADAFAEHVNSLADPALGGRVSGTAGNRAAASYIAAQFFRIGLTPAGDGASFFQSFTNDRLLVPTQDCQLRFEFTNPAATQPTTLVGQLDRDFAPSAQGKFGAFAAPLVFAGYGVHNRIRGYDDYAQLSARGAVVMILAGEPHDPTTGQSRWAVPGDTTYWAELPNKLRLARQHGAVAALVVTPPALMPEDCLDDVLGDCTAALPCVRITRQFADRIIAATGRGETINQLIASMHRDRRPASFSIGGTVTGTINLTAATCRNVVGVLPPDDSGQRTEADSRLSVPVTLIGAHYDHVPATGQLACDEAPGVRPGANDNASGVAAMLLLARGLAATPRRSRTYVFVAFDSEEIGFAGSRHYVRRPACPLEDVDVMINLDEVGRVGDRGVLVLGSTLDSSLGRAVIEAARRSPLRVTPLPVTSATRWSDQAAFVRAGVPTLFIYGCRCETHHTRRDTADKVNSANGAAVARLAWQIIVCPADRQGTVPPDPADFRP